MTRNMLWEYLLTSKKTFDTTDDEMLLKKPERYDIRGAALKTGFSLCRWVITSQRV